MTPEDHSVDDERLLVEAYENVDPHAGEDEDLGLDPNVLAGFLEHRLTDDERAHVIEVLGDSALAREQLAQAAMYVSFDGQPPARVAPAPSRWRAVSWAAAALLVVGIGLAVMSFVNTNDGPAYTLADAGEALRDRNGDLFADFDPQALLPDHVVVERGGPTVLTPTGALLEGRPTVTWAPVSGVRVFRVLVRDDEGQVRYEQTAMEPSLAYPKSSEALPAGAYVVVVSANTPSGEVRSSRAFSVLDEATAQRYRLGLIAIENDVSRGLRDAVMARWALHFDLVEEAGRVLDLDVLGIGGGTDRQERVVLRYVKRRLGRDPR